MQKLIAPTMNTQMFENPILQDNLKKCASYGMEIIDPASGYLACGDTGAGKMPEPEDLLEYIVREAAFEKDMAGKKVLVTSRSQPRKPLIRFVILPITPPGNGYSHCARRLPDGEPR